MERNSLSNGLAHIGRRSYVSQRGLAAVFKELHEQGLLSDVTSRRTIKRARDDDIRANTVHGPVMRSMKIQLQDPEEEISLAYIHPCAVLSHAASNCLPFGRCLKQLMYTTPSTPSKPWRLVIYSDEISPGNQLKHDNKRKVQAIYWSLMEFGPSLLSSEASWFVLSVVRSSQAHRMVGGMSFLLSKLLQTFFHVSSDLSKGVMIHCPEGSAMLCATIGCIASDGDALKQTWDCKGASGNLVCMLCRNVVRAASRLHETDTTGFLVPAFETNTARFVLHTDASVLELVKQLQRDQCTMFAATGRRRSSLKAALLRQQVALGFNLCPTGLLLSGDLPMMVKPISWTVYDWMHVYVVNGFFNIEAGKLLGQLAQAQITHQQIHVFCQTFQWPHRLASRSASGKSVFQKRAKTWDNLKCSASDALSVFGVLRAFLMMHVMPLDVGTDLKAACNSYFLVCKVLELLMRIPRGNVSPNDLHFAIVSHMDAFKQVHGDASCVPKCHWALHLSAMLEQHGFLVSCFVHERKHKEIKRYANELDNTCPKFETNLLENALYVQLAVLSEPGSLQMHSDKARLTSPRPAPLRLTALVQKEFGTGAAVYTATTAVHGCMQQSSRKDVVVVELGDELRVSEIWFHFEVDGSCFTCVSLWTNLGHNRFQIEEAPVFIHTEDIRDTCVWSRRGDVAIVLPTI
jgi:hypothetical protein